MTTQKFLLAADHISTWVGKTMAYNHYYAKSVAPAAGKKA